MPQQTEEQRQKRQEQLVDQIRQVVSEELLKHPFEGDIDKQSVNVERVKEVIREIVPTLLARSIVSIEGNLQLLDSRNIIVGSTTGSKVATSNLQKLGFWGIAPIIRPTNGADLTNNVTDGGTTDQIDNFTDLSTYANDAATIRNNIYQLAKKLKVVNDALRGMGLMS